MQEKKERSEMKNEWNSKKKKKICNCNVIVMILLCVQCACMVAWPTSTKLRMNLYLSFRKNMNNDDDPWSLWIYEKKKERTKNIIALFICFILLKLIVAMLLCWISFFFSGSLPFQLPF